MLLLLFWLWFVAEAQFIAQVKEYREGCGAIGDFYFCTGSLSVLDDNIINLEPDDTVQVQGCQYNPPWHLKNARLAYSYDSSRTGRDVTVYIVDTLVDITHADLEGRARVGYSSVNGMHYHGTHVAGIIGSRTYGVAKKANLVSVAVLDETGRGSYSEILKGLEFIGKQAKKGIINMSLGGSFSSVINNAVEALEKLGHIVVAAAGNDAQNACETSPASANVLTVAAFDITYTFASFSNYGKCVDVAAPGVSIESTLPNNSVGLLSGTSMATPYVSGVLAVFASGRAWPSKQEAVGWLTHTAIQNKLRERPIDTPDLCAQQILRDASCKTIKGALSKLHFLTQ